jgi:hypothetical protein
MPDCSGKLLNERLSVMFQGQMARKFEGIWGERHTGKEFDEL